jgi:hypothetical protein
MGRDHASNGSLGSLQTDTQLSRKDKLMTSRGLLRGSAFGLAMMGMATGVPVGCAPRLAGAPGVVATSDSTSTEGTISFTAGEMALGIGFQWGSGILTFRGRQYPFYAHGISALDIGVNQVSVAGTVRNLHNVAEFGGNYVAFVAGGALGSGGAVAALRNQNGVTIEGISTTKGLRLKLSAGSMNVTLAEQGYSAGAESISRGTEP